MCNMWRSMLWQCQQRGWWHVLMVLQALSLPVGKFSSHAVFLSVLFCSLVVLDPRVGHTMDALSPFISVLCHSDWLFHGESCPHLNVVHLGCVWSFLPACTWRCSLHYLFQKTPLVSSWCDHSMLVSLLCQCLTVPSLLQLC